MKALVLTEYLRLEFLDVPAPTPGPEDVLVRVEACGICGSDVHGFDGSTGRRIPPIIMGHEAAGVVVEAGAGAGAWRPGDRVTFDSTVYCGKCPFCRAGRINLCDDRRVLGVSCGEYRRDGAFAELAAVPQRILHRLPDGVSFVHAAMTEPLAVAFHAVRRLPIAFDAAAVVVGAGMIGLLALQALAELPGFTLHVAGNHAEPRFAEYWRHAVAALGLSTRVVMHGWVDDIPGWFRSVPINYVLSTSPWEGCPNNVIEAMAHGIKPLVHNWPGATEMFGPELVWSRLDELPGMVNDQPYLADRYQDQVRERFSRERIMPVVEDFVARMAGDGTIRGQFNRTRELVEMEDAQCLVPAT